MPLAKTDLSKSRYSTKRYGRAQTIRCWHESSRPLSNTSEIRGQIVRRCILTIGQASRRCTVYFGELTFGHKDTGMSKMNPSELAKKIGEGLLSFPVTHFTRELQFAERPDPQHIPRLLGVSP